MELIFLILGFGVVAASFGGARKGRRPTPAIPPGFGTVAKAVAQNDIARGVHVDEINGLLGGTGKVAGSTPNPPQNSSADPFGSLEKGGAAVAKGAAGFFDSPSSPDASDPVNNSGETSEENSPSPYTGEESDSGYS